MVIIRTSTVDVSIHAVSPAESFSCANAGALMAINAGIAARNGPVFRNIIMYFIPQ